MEAFKDTSSLSWGERESSHPFFKKQPQYKYTPYPVLAGSGHLYLEVKGS